MAVRVVTDPSARLGPQAMTDMQAWRRVVVPRAVIIIIGMVALVVATYPR